MPQVDTQNLGKALDMASDKVKVTKGKIEAGKLKKSQKELHQDKIEGIAKRFTSPDKFKPLIISQDNHIVDGHHRWGAAIHKWGEDVKIPIFRIHLPILKAIKLYKDIANSINEAMSIAARRKLARKGKSRLKRASKKRLLKMKRKRSNDDLKKASIRKAKTILMQKMMKKAPADMTMVDKMKFSQKIEKKPGKIQKIAKKILPKLKQAETERVRKMRSKNVQKANEDITIPINVGDTVLGGKFKNKRIVVKSIEKNEKGDITINGKPLLKFRLVNENMGVSTQCPNCNHSWDLEYNDDRKFLCHNCGYDSQMQKIDLVGLRDWKKTLKENVAPNHNGKSAPYGSGYDEMDEANAVSGGKVHKFITGKNLTYQGKKYSEIDFELVRIDNTSQLVHLKVLAPKQIFGSELKVPFKTIRRGPFLKTDTSKQFEGTINEIPMADLQKIDQFADKKLNPVDVVLTGKHFFDRLNDPRNDKEISSAELIGFFKRLSKKKKEFLDFLDKYNQIVTTDDRTNINIPFMKQSNKVIAKTVMRKKDFKTPNKKLEI
jgi:transposase-like protein